MREIAKVFVVGTLGLAVMLVLAGYLHARETQVSCNAKGYVLCSGGNCGSKTCSNGGTPGQNFCNALKCYMCDGCTGKWVEVGRSQSIPPPPGPIHVPPAAR